MVVVPFFDIFSEKVVIGSQLVEFHELGCVCRLKCHVTAASCGCQKQ